MQQKGRLKLLCWRCEEEFSLFRTLDIDEKPRFIEVCPYCRSECVVDLAPYRSEAVEIYKGVEQEALPLGHTLDLSQVFPTSQPEAQ